MDVNTNTPDYDFCGWASRNNLECSDGRIIRQNAFQDNNGMSVPLVWNHDHTDPYRILGHAVLENRPEGVYAYGYFNDSDLANTAKMYVQHGDINQMSIWANQLKQQGPNVIHGNIREVSLVMAGANPGAYIENVIAHGVQSDDEAFMTVGGSIDRVGLETEESLVHSDADTTDDYAQELEHADKEDKKMPDNTKPKSNEKTIGEIVDSMTEEQKQALYAIVGMAVQDKGGDTEGGEENMKHNVFDNENYSEPAYLSHADQEDILNLAKSSQVGSFQAALDIYSQNNGLELQHDAFEGGDPSGFADVTPLFPDYKDVRPGAPELITNDQGWISTVMSKVHKSPISRIRTGQVDIRKAEQLRAKGYKKGSKKTLTGNFNLVRRTTDPQTIYVKNMLYRDDIVDITDFDYVQYLYNIDRMMLNEEIATAIMLGDGRDEGDQYKIAEDKIRPIWKDDDLYTIHVDLDISKAREELQGTGTGTSFGENYIYAEALINTVLYARENFKGSGTPDFYLTPHMLNVMLLARDMNGRRIYSSKAELASALNVGNIITCEQFEGKVRTTTDSKKKKLLGLIVNLADYSLGATKGGEVTHFTDFDIDFNAEKSLLETRCSGALTRIYSAIAIEEPVTPASASEADGVSG